MNQDDDRNTNNSKDKINSANNTKEKTSLGVKILYTCLFIIILILVLIFTSQSGIKGFVNLIYIGLLILFAPLILLFVTLSHIFKEIKKQPEINEKTNLVNMDLKNRTQNIREFYSNNIINENIENSGEIISQYLNEDTQKIVDLGIGQGQEIEFILKKFPDIKIKAIDLVPEFLKVLREKNITKNLNVVCGNFFDVVFENENDAIIASNSLHYYDCELKKRLYKKIFDSLKTNGKFISLDIFANDENEERKHLEAYINNKNVKNLINTPLYINTEKRILESVGFKNIEIVPIENTNYKLLIAIKN